MSLLEKDTVTRGVYLRGSCACGRIAFAASARPITSQSCHCVSCQKLSGSSCQTFVDFPAHAITFFDQHEHLRYEGLPVDNSGGFVFLRLSQTGERAFCLSCHTPLAMRYTTSPDVVFIPLGSVDEETIADAETKELLRPKSHIFTSQQAWWVDLHRDGLPMYARGPSSSLEDELQPL